MLATPCVERHRQKELNTGRAALYLAQKQPRGRPKCGQIVHIRTGEKLAKELGVNGKTIRRDADFARRLDADQAESLVGRATGCAFDVPYPPAPGVRGQVSVVQTVADPQRGFVRQAIPLVNVDGQ